MYFYGPTPAPNAPCLPKPISGGWQLAFRVAGVEIRGTRIEPPDANHWRTSLAYFTGGFTARSSRRNPSHLVSKVTDCGCDSATIALFVCDGGVQPASGCVGVGRDRKRKSPGARLFSRAHCLSSVLRSTTRRRWEPSFRRRLWAFDGLRDPAELVSRKLQSNCWEDAYTAKSSHSEARPLNLDPGYVTEAKLVLATTKDRDHRVYVGQGIFAEVDALFSRRRLAEKPLDLPGLSDE